MAGNGGIEQLRVLGQAGPVRFQLCQPALADQPIAGAVVVHEQRRIRALPGKPAEIFVRTFGLAGRALEQAGALRVHAVRDPIGVLVEMDLRRHHPAHERPARIVGIHPVLLLPGRNLVARCSTPARCPSTSCSRSNARGGCRRCSGNPAAVPVRYHASPPLQMLVSRSGVSNNGCRRDRGGSSFCAVRRNRREQQ